VTRILYHLFKWFPSLELASRDASTRLYDEYLDRQRPYMGEAPALTVIHDDGDEPE
jgi:hypothetical protein